MTYPSRLASHALGLPDALPPMEGRAPGAPEWIHLLPSGEFTGRDGRGPYRLPDPDAVIAATREWFGQADMPIDYNHQSEIAASNGRPAPAAGWVKALEARPDGVWARVSWTERAARAVAAREFRYISPVFFHAADGRVLLLRSAALTNLPNLELAALSHSLPGPPPANTKESPMPEPNAEITATLAAAAGLAPDTCAADMATALAQRRDQLSGACAALGVSDPAQLEQAAREAARLARNPDPARFVPLAMHEALSRELADLKARQADAAAGALVEEAARRGKLTSAMHEWAKGYAGGDPDGFRQWLDAAPVVAPGNGGGAGTAPPPGAASGAPDALKAVCAVFGYDPATLIKDAKTEEAGHGGADTGS